MTERKRFNAGVKKCSGKPGVQIFSRVAREKRLLNDIKMDRRRAAYVEANKPYYKYDGGAMTLITRDKAEVHMRTGYLRWDAGDSYVIATKEEWDAHHRDIEKPEGSA
jgi:hypothetical protein